MSVVLVTVPLLVTKFPPSADLPQHVSQVALALGDVADSATVDLEVDWFRPNNLVYLFVLASYKVFGPTRAAGATLGILLVLQVLGLSLLLRRSPYRLAFLPLLSIFFFNQSLYWGFLNFLVGWPAFCLWLWLLRSDLPDGWRRWVFLALASGVTLYSHVLWFLAGCGVTCLWMLCEGRSRIRFHVSTLLPFGVIALVWYAGLHHYRAEVGYDMAAHWVVKPWERLRPSFLVRGFFGGLRNVVEDSIRYLVLGWLGLSLLTHRRGFWKRSDRMLLAVGLALFTVSLLFPDKYSNTTFFASRWMSYGMILILAAAPPPRPLSRPFVRVTALLVAVIYVSTTAGMWYLYDEVELSGLEEAIDVLPEKSTVLGLSFVKASQFVAGRPFLHLFAYSQAIKGADLNFSFAQHGTGIARYTEPRRQTWTQNLEWNPELLQPSDLSQFEHVLVNGGDPVHEQLGQSPLLIPMTDSGRWRLYRSRGRSDTSEEIGQGAH
ncbi:MAG: hypothetical protein KDD47_24630 [Acidobacteria bacterium]|nr:hypothetical protein [Acidobacteriota bacterium]